VTRQADSAILNGSPASRSSKSSTVRAYGLVERPFLVAEAMSSHVTFLTSTVVDLLPVVRIDGGSVGKGQAGPLSRKLGECYLAHATARVIAK
jgi:D-alanine transaminase